MISLGVNRSKNQFHQSSNEIAFFVICLWLRFVATIDCRDESICARALHGTQKLLPWDMTLVDLPKRNPWQLFHGSPSSSVINKRTNLQQISSSCVRKACLIYWYIRFRLYRRKQRQYEKLFEKNFCDSLWNRKWFLSDSPRIWQRVTKVFFEDFFILSLLSSM